MLPCISVCLCMCLSMQDYKMGTTWKIKDVIIFFNQFYGIHLWEIYNFVHGTSIFELYF